MSKKNSQSKESGKDGLEEQAESANADATTKTEQDTTPPEAEKVDVAPTNVSELDELNQKCIALQEQYMRKAADFDNYRKRMIREKQEAIDYANTNLLLDLLEILDGFDRAIGSIGSPEAGSPLESFSQGVIMIRDQMNSMLSSKYGLEYTPAKGEAFDPNIHEAVASVQSKEVTEATIGEELQKGYRLRQRIIRHAKVMVLMPEANASNSKEEE